MRRLSPLALVSLVATTGCSEDKPAYEDRTAVVGTGDHAVEFALDVCGLDGDTFRLSGQGESGEVLEAEFAAVSDGETRVTEVGSLTLLDYDGDEDLAVYGEETWAGRGTTGEAPGENLTVRITGTLIQMAGQIVVVDDDRRPTDDELRPFVLDAHCDDQD